MVISKDFIWYARLNPIALEDEYQLNHTPPGRRFFDYQGIIDNRKRGSHTFRKTIFRKINLPSGP